MKRGSSFDASRPLYARHGSVDRPLTVNGRSYVRGDLLSGGLAERLALRLWEQGRITHEAPAVDSGAAQPAKRTSRTSRTSE